MLFDSIYTWRSRIFKRKSTVIVALFALILLPHFYPPLKEIVEISKPVKFFFAGIFCYTFKDYIVISYKIAGAIIVVCCIVYFACFKIFIWVFYVTLIYCMLIAATSDTAKKIKLPGDYSYGVYIYGFLVQQLIAHCFPQITAYPSMIITMPISFILGAVSWHYIELPAINKGKFLTKKYDQLLFISSKDSRFKTYVTNPV